MPDKYPYIAGVNYESLVDGRGVRAAIFLSGCSHHCPNCQNQQTWDDKYGKAITDSMITDIASEIAKRPFVKGITLTGGDPMYSPEKTLNFLNRLKEELVNRGSLTASDIWLYTGYTWEELLSMQDESTQALVRSCDVIVDGRFIQAQADRRLKFRGSRNQRIIDVYRSLNSNGIVILK